MAIPALVTACMDEKFSSDPSHLLEFSADTIYFDTLFSGVGSATSVYNRHDASLMFSLALAGRDTSGYRINVDGRTDVGVDRFDGLSIRGGDSLYVFIELTARQQGTAAIGQVADRLVFTTNGVEQRVELLAYGRDAVTLRGPVVTRDTTFTASSSMTASSSPREPR